MKGGAQQLGGLNSIRYITHIYNVVTHPHLHSATLLIFCLNTTLLKISAMVQSTLQICVHLPSPWLQTGKFRQEKLVVIINRNQCWQPLGDEIRIVASEVLRCRFMRCCNNIIITIILSVTLRVDSSYSYNHKSLESHSELCKNSVASKHFKDWHILNDVWKSGAM